MAVSGSPSPPWSLRLTFEQTNSISFLQWQQFQQFLADNPSFNAASGAPQPSTPTPSNLSASAAQEPPQQSQGMLDFFFAIYATQSDLNSRTCHPKLPECAHSGPTRSPSCPRASCGPCTLCCPRAVPAFPGDAHSCSFCFDNQCFTCQPPTLARNLGSQPQPPCARKCRPSPQRNFGRRQARQGHCPAQSSPRQSQRTQRAQYRHLSRCRCSSPHRERFGHGLPPSPSGAYLCSEFPTY